MALSIDGLTLKLLVEEIAPQIRGSEVAGVFLNQALFEISLCCDKAMRLSCLLQPGFSLLCLRQTAAREGERNRIDRFETHIYGTAVLDLKQIDLDRVVVLSLKTPDEQALNVSIELISPFPNVFLLDEGNKVIDLLFSRGLSTRSRTIARGMEYELPKQEKIDPLSLDMAEIETIHVKSAGDTLSRIAGFGKLISIEVQSLVDSGLCFADALTQILDKFKNGEIEPCTFEVSEEISPSLPRIGISWFRPTNPWVRKIESAKSLNAAACHVLQTYLRTTAAEKKRAALLRSIRQRVSKLESLYQSLPDPKEQLKEADKYRKFAELLLANMATIRKGQAKVKVTDLYSPDHDEIEIPLSPELSPQLNVEAYFKKAKKARNRAAFAQQRLQGLTREIAELKKLLSQIESLSPHGPELKKIVGSANIQEHASQPSEERDQKAERLGIRPRRYITADGWTVLVGRSARENDILTHQYASPHDLWFHARQAQGSHVILRKGKTKKQVSKQAILEAAAIAAYYSKARTSKNVPVSYTEKRYVKKVRKGPPGLCALLREEVVFVDPKLP